MREREVKLSAPPGYTLPDLADPDRGLAPAPLAARQLRTTYYDTADLRLARWGVSLRHRSGEGWTVKLSGEARGPLLVREERVFQAPANRPPSTWSAPSSATPRWSRWPGSGPPAAPSSCVARTVGGSAR